MVVGSFFSKTHHVQIRTFTNLHGSRTGDPKHQAKKIRQRLGMDQALQENLTDAADLEISSRS